MIVITWKRSNLCSNLCTQLQSNYFKELSCNTTVAIGESPSDKCEKLHTVATSNNRDNTSCSLDYCLFAPRIYGCYSSLVVNRTFNATPTERLQQHPLLFYNETHARSFCKGCTWPDLHILVTAPFCYDRKAWVRKASRRDIKWQ